jgi:hypothetical protein
VVVTVTNGKAQLYAMELMAKKDQP